MDDPNRLEAKGLARAKIRAKRRRVQTIRRRTLRGSLTLFAVVWAIVLAQLVSGNDPALSGAPAADRRTVAHNPPPRAEFAPQPEPESIEEVAPEPEPAYEPEPEPEPIVTAAS